MLVCPAGVQRHDALQEAGRRQERDACLPAERHHLPAAHAAAATALRARVM